MKVDHFALRFAGARSFHAHINQSQKITVVEPFCVLESDPLPMCVGMCSVDVRMQFEPVDEGVKTVRISFTDEDGKPVALPSLETTVDVKMPAHAVTALVPLAFMLKQLSLPAFGEYSVDLSVDGRLEASTVLHVRRKVSG